MPPEEILYTPLKESLEEYKEELLEAFLNQNSEEIPEKLIVGIPEELLEKSV